MEKYEVVDNKIMSRFEVKDEGETAFLEYDADDHEIALLHTEVPGDIGGKGIANALAAYSFRYAEEHGLKVLIYCPFVAIYVKRHPELNAQVKERK
jgi:predicted GNAT family acetyltransferase